MTRQLHAHLTGSISRDCLGDVWRMKKDKDPSLALQDPLVAMPVTGASDITT
jgi:adenosine deaminase